MASAIRPRPVIDLSRQTSVLCIHGSPSRQHSRAMSETCRIWLSAEAALTSRWSCSCRTDELVLVGYGSSFSTYGQVNYRSRFLVQSELRPRARARAAAAGHEQAGGQMTDDEKIATRIDCQRAASCTEAVLTDRTYICGHHIGGGIGGECTRVGLTDSNSSKLSTHMLDSAASFRICTARDYASPSSSSPPPSSPPSSP
jgi:hypothetical protein